MQIVWEFKEAPDKLIGRKSCPPLVEQGRLVRTVYRAALGPAYLSIIYRGAINTRYIAGNWLNNISKIFNFCKLVKHVDWPDKQVSHRSFECRDIYNVVVHICSYFGVRRVLCTTSFCVHSVTVNSGREKRHYEISRAVVRRSSLLRRWLPEALTFPTLST